jgi:hypothetical protein
MDDRLVFLQAELLQHAVELVRPEDAHQVVLQREEELGASIVALATAAAAQLVIDAPRFMALGAEHEQTAGGDGLGPQLRHVVVDFKALGDDFRELGFDRFELRGGIRRTRFRRLLLQLRQGWEQLGFARVETPDTGFDVLAQTLDDRKLARGQRGVGMRVRVNQNPVARKGLLLVFEIFRGECCELMRPRPAFFSRLLVFQLVC